MNTKGRKQDQETHKQLTREATKETKSIILEKTRPGVVPLMSRCTPSRCHVVGEGELPRDLQVQGGGRGWI